MIFFVFFKLKGRRFDGFIDFIEPPTFNREMKNKQVKFGDAVVLECMAAGAPKPKITWSKDGKPVVLTKRHYLAADDQLLFISNTMLADMGTYECELSNTLGYVRGRSKLIALSGKLIG